MSEVPVRTMKITQSTLYLSAEDVLDMPEGVLLGMVLRELGHVHREVDEQYEGITRRSGYVQIAVAVHHDGWALDDGLPDGEECDA